MTDANDDGVWVARCLRGDPSAFEPLVERYQRVLWTVALRILGNQEDARDAVQNAFIRAYQRLETYDPGRKFFSWMYRIAVNECLNAIRARHETEELDANVQTDAGIVEALEVTETQDMVQRALTHLTPPLRQVVVLRHFAELSYEEIGAATGIPVKTVKSRLFTARQRLAELLVAEGKRS